MAKHPHVVIVGGGFGGLAAAQSLRRAPVRVTVVDRRNHHLFQPLLYQVATAALSPGDIAYPIRSALARQKNAEVLLAEVRAVRPAEKVLELDDGEIAYDYLILAAGAKTSYFGNDWAAHAPGLKCVEDAVDVRRRILLAYEAAEREDDPKQREALMTFAVVGAGPTGVELAGALAEIGRHTLARDFRRIDPRLARVILIEGGERVLPDFPVGNSKTAHAQLEKLGVEVMLNSRVTNVDEAGMTVGDERVPARTVLWAAGIKATPLAGTLGVPLADGGRIPVSEELAVPGCPGVYAIGDMAHIKTREGVVPGLAPAAAQAGRCAAKNIVRDLQGDAGKPFRYVDKGTLATVGRTKAVGHFRGTLRFGGAFAWVLWWAIHIFFLIGFRNRLAVMLGWVWNFVTFQRGARLITGALPASAREREPARSRPSAKECDERQMKDGVIVSLADVSTPECHLRRNAA